MNLDPQWISDIESQEPCSRRRFAWKCTLFSLLAGAAYVAVGYIGG